jgi:hypothetical protein
MQKSRDYQVIFCAPAKLMVQSALGECGRGIASHPTLRAGQHDSYLMRLIELPGVINTKNDRQV